MNLPVGKPELRATRIKALQGCSWEFYCSNVLKMPERVWSKTLMGTLCHLVLEVLVKRPDYYKKYIETGTYKSIPSLERLVAGFLKKHPRLDVLHFLELDKLVLVGLNYDFYPEGIILPAPKPEYEFSLDIGTAKVKGVIDRIHLYKDHARIIDYKSQAKKFTGEEMENNIQAAMYQLVVKQVFGLPSTVEFVLLRFPPNKKNPTRHLQIIQPYTDAQLNGFKSYLQYLYVEFQNFTEEKGRLNLKAFKDIFFCHKVCGFKDPFKYWAATKNGLVSRTSKTEIFPLEDEIVSEHFYPGCPYHYSEEGRPRNYS